MYETVSMVQQTDRERQQLTESLRAVRRTMARAMLIGAVSALGQSDLTLAQLGSLVLLDDGRERSVKEMAELLGRSVSAMSRLLDQLVKRKLIKRWEDARDRRVRLISIADAGRKLINAFTDKRAEAQLQLMTRLTPEEREQVHRGMLLLAEAARRKVDE